MRRTELDICRVLGCLAVLVIHAGAEIYHDLPLDSAGFAAVNFLSTAVRGGVPLFFMLSGALLLSREESAGICAEIYPDALKMKKQLAYADSRRIAFVAILGGDEMASGSITVKELATGQQTKVAQRELVDFLLNR